MNDHSNAGSFDCQAGAPGRARLEVNVVFGESTVTSAYASNPMKMLTPISRGPSIWAYTSSFGGGLVAGDETRLEIALGPEARCFLGTQSSTKVYRNPARLPCSHTTTAMLGEGSLLVFAPEPVQSFAEAHYDQRQEFRLGSGAGLALLDWFSSGRAARGERWEFSHFESRNDVFVEGERVFLDAVLLENDDVPEQMGRFNCIATLVLVGQPLDSYAAEMHARVASRPVDKRAALACSSSLIRRGVLLRVAGEEVETVRRELHSHLEWIQERLGDDPWRRKW